MYNLEIYILLFMIYSVIGWGLEVINMLLKKRRFINRGFLIGPYCPIYGFGSILMIYFLTDYKSNPVVLFVNCVFICGVLEYFTSYIMEKLFKTRWWDYTKNKFNINGRICLETLFLFGIGGLAIIYMANPFIMNMIDKLSDKTILIIDIVLLTIFLIDNIISFNIINSFKKTASSIRKDSTEEVSKKVRQVLSEKSYFSKRLVNAFPKFKPVVKKYDKVIKKVEKQKLKIEKEKKKLKKIKKKRK